MKHIAQLPATQRVQKLRDYYLHNAPMAVNRDLTCWHCHRSRLLYAEGWKTHFWTAPTQYMLRSYAEAHLLENTRPVILPGELIVGQPDFSEYTPEELLKKDELEEWARRIPLKRGRDTHYALDYTLLLEKGIEGILEILDEKLAAIDADDGTQTARYEFYWCCKHELEGLAALSRHYADEAQRLADEAQGEERAELLVLHEVLQQVPMKPARTFREALQSVHTFTWSLYGLFSYGKPDVFLLPYYRRDIEQGILTPAEAQELIDCFFLQSVTHMPAWAAEGMMLSGRDARGQYVENELTWHFLTAIRHTRIPDPNVGFCVLEETSEELLDYVTRLIAEGHAQPSVWNADAVTRSLLKNGFEPEAARMFTLSTCVEVTPIGCSGVSITSPYINTLRILLTALDGCDDTAGFEDVFAAFRREFADYCRQAILEENLYQLERGRNTTDATRCSVLINDCLERGVSVDGGGARYNLIEPNLLGMQNVSESLNCIYRLVFEQKKVTLSEYKKALAANYEGYGELRSYILHKVPHFGTGDAVANGIQRRVADLALETFAGKTTVRGARVIPGAFSYRDHVFHGEETGASPDGRLAWAPLNDGSNPVQGYDNQGPTVSLASTVSWEPSRFLGGTSVNVKINRGVTAAAIKALVKGYLRTEGVQMQFNIVSPQELLDAQRHPEEHGDLLVRIGGYSDFFVKLPKSLQDDVISRTCNEM